MNTIESLIKTNIKSILGGYFSWKYFTMLQSRFYLKDICVLKNIGPLKIGDKFTAIVLKSSDDGCLNVLLHIREDKDNALFNHLYIQGLNVSSGAGNNHITVDLSDEFPIQIVITLRNQKL